MAEISSVATEIVNYSEDDYRFKISHSQPIYFDSVLLNSEAAQKLFERIFLRVSNSIYRIEWLFRIINRDSASDEFREMIEQDIQAAYEAFETAEADANKLLKNNGIVQLPEYTKGKEFAYAITTPQANQLIGLIKKVDELDKIMSALWLTGVIKTTQRYNYHASFRNKINKIGQRILEFERKTRSLINNRGNRNQVRQVSQASKEIKDQIIEKQNVLEQEKKLPDKKIASEKNKESSVENKKVSAS